MKKLSLLFALLAGIAVMTGCKKDQTVVTFQAVIDQDQNTKAYFGTPVRPYWNTDDSVCIMAPGYRGKLICGLSDVTETYAKIEGVQSSEGCYCAIYPVEAIHRIGTPQSDGTTQAVIYFDPHQEYIWENNHQRVNMIMGAVTDNDSKTFHFKNLCSILRLKVTNNLPDSLPNRTMNVRRITVYGYGAYVAGCAEVTLTKSGEPVITVNQLGSNAENVLSVYKSDNTYMKTLAFGATDSFDVVVPPFSADSLNIELEMFDGTGKFIGNSDNDIKPTGTNTKVTLTRNKIVTIELNVSKFETPDYAYLAQGPVFNNIIKSLIGNEDVVNITFNTSWESIDLPLEGTTQAELDRSTQYNGWKIVSRADSPLQIFARLIIVEGKKHVQVLSHANYMYADANCIGMFRGLESLQTINIDQNDDGTGFQTEDVTDMSYMFAGCTHLTSVAGLTNLNLTNVTNMAHMFENCTAVNTIDMNPVNTHNLLDTGLVAMFKGCTMVGTVNLSSFNTEHVTSLREMFMGCEHLTTVSLSSFNTAEVTDMSYFCYGCWSLPSIDLSSFTTNGVTNMSYFFAGCEKLTSINMRQFVISNNTNIDSMCHRLNYVNLPVNQRNPSRAPCYITCRRSTWNTMKGQATASGHFQYGTPDPTTGFTVTVIYDRDVFDDPTSK